MSELLEKSAAGPSAGSAPRRLRTVTFRSRSLDTLEEVFVSEPSRGVAASNLFPLPTMEGSVPSDRVECSASELADMDPLAAASSIARPSSARRLKSDTPLEDVKSEFRARFTLLFASSSMAFCRAVRRVVDFCLRLCNCWSSADTWFRNSRSMLSTSSSSLARLVREMAGGSPVCLALRVRAGRFLPTCLGCSSFFSAVALAQLLHALDVKGK